MEELDQVFWDTCLMFAWMQSIQSGTPLVFELSLEGFQQKEWELHCILRDRYEPIKAVARKRLILEHLCTITVGTWNDGQRYF